MSKLNTVSCVEPAPNSCNPATWGCLYGVENLLPRWLRLRACRNGDIRWYSVTEQSSWNVTSQDVKGVIIYHSFVLLPLLKFLYVQPSQVSTHVALDHQTYSALAQHTPSTWTAVLKLMSLPGWGGGGWITLHINRTFMYGQLDQLAIKSPNTDFLKRT